MRLQLFVQFIWKHGMANMNSPTAEVSIAAKKRAEGGNSNENKIWTCPLLFETSICCKKNTQSTFESVYCIVCLFQSSKS